MPAAASTLAYLNARWQVTSDLQSLKRLLLLTVNSLRAEKRDRVNLFYVLEAHATNPKTAFRTFLVIPRDSKLVSRQTEWTYSEAYETVLKYAAWLKDAYRISKDEIVAMDFTNRPEFIFVWFALWSLGAKPAFINTNLRGKAFVHCVRTANSRLVFIDPEIQEILDEETRHDLETLDEKGRAIESVILTADTQRTILAGQAYRAPDEARSGAKVKDTGILIYTSGTTGLPKAANVTWSKPAIGGGFVAQWLDLKPSDRFLTAMPLYHTSASVLGLCVALTACVPLIMLPKFSPRTFMQQAAETKATTIQYVGEMCRYLVSSPPSVYDKSHSVRLAFGNGLRPDVWQKFKDRFNIPTIAEFYGATEAPTASWNISHNDFTRGAIGQSGLLMRLLFSPTQAFVRHDHDTDAPFRDPRTSFCTQCAVNEPGEMIMKLDPANIADKFQGYHGNSKANSGKILRNVFAKDDAWYRSGDLLRRDSEGRTWFVDRIGDTFRWKGENVSTAEVSESLGRHPALREANVYGVSLPGHDGRAGCAAIVLADGKTLDAGLASDLAAHARKTLPRYAVPIFLRLVQGFEVTGTMKQTKNVLRNEGVDPANMGGDKIFWLPPAGEAYVEFTKRDWEHMAGGSVKL